MPGQNNTARNQAGGAAARHRAGWWLRFDVFGTRGGSREVMAGMGGRSERIDLHAGQLLQRGGNAGAVGRVGLVAVVDVALLDEVRCIAQGAGGVFEQALLLGIVVAAEQRAGLGSSN